MVISVRIIQHACNASAMLRAALDQTPVADERVTKKQKRSQVQEERAVSATSALRAASRWQLGSQPSGLPCRKSARSSSLLLCRQVRVTLCSSIENE